MSTATTQPPGPRGRQRPHPPAPTSPRAAAAWCQTRQQGASRLRCGAVGSCLCGRTCSWLATLRAPVERSAAHLEQRAARAAVSVFESVTHGLYAPQHVVTPRKQFGERFCIAWLPPAQRDRHRLIRWRCIGGHRRPPRCRIDRTRMHAPRLVRIAMSGSQPVRMQQQTRSRAASEQHGCQLPMRAHTQGAEKQACVPCTCINGPHGGCGKDQRQW